LSSTTPHTGDSHLRFGQWLLDRRMLDGRQVAAALADQQENGGRLGEVLCRLQLLPEDQVCLSTGHRTVS